MAVFIRIKIKSATDARAVGKWLLFTVKILTVRTVLPRRLRGGASRVGRSRGPGLAPVSPWPSVGLNRAGLTLLLNTTNA